MTTEEKIATITNTVDDVKGIISENIDKVIERGTKIDQLEEKSKLLETQSSNFNKVTKKKKIGDFDLERNQDSAKSGGIPKKVIIFIILLVILILLAVILPFIFL
ncbi:vesicle-associated membrane protein [Anaeramoeba flamelloides]|uniref:Vesicle-associated membrane protein n=1 Tax=Anaeramoeba flamelloides TaxID=1746091 RepID=A0ABQ8Y1X7_9EUKA|nr:vesicle-associated membrane protein [Anaeramoeba flamelloides]